jgi:hypothetical protein
MKRMFAWVGGALGFIALLRLRRRRAELPPAPVGPDPADELKRRLEEARDAVDDRDDYDAAEGQAVDEIEPTRSIAERRQAVHEKAQEALGEMKPTELRSTDDD